MKIYKSDQYPKKAIDLDGNELSIASVDVFTQNVDGILNIAFYDYDYGIWNFHISGFNENNNGELLDFVWMYRPKDLTL